MDQHKALDVGNTINIGIEIKILGSKVWQLLAYHGIFTQRLQQEINASTSSADRRRLLVCQVLCLHL